MNMNPEEWKRVRDELETALGLDGPAREAHLDVLRSRDAALAAAVVELLARDTDSVVDNAPSPEPFGELFAAPALEPGTRLGAYRVEGLIASGGMGSVYRAERADAQFEKSVAIKLIKRGMDSEEILRRFRYERQVLAALEHPGIARLLDGGVSQEGQPYFVMEYVEGAPIDQWCDDRRLGIDARLELFQKICVAVHYAHQHLVVHRDLKPSNILVTESGEPKLLDFGVARMLDPEGGEELSRSTAEQGFFGTPSYASPEQLLGERVTTATDVYSLGVVLYRLLAGKRPYELSKVSRAEGARLVCEVDPTPPSRAAADPGGAGNTRRLEGDLDTIVLMALRKEPERRYASAEQLADDVQRHLDGQPVIARPNTLSYRAAKFFGRNRAASLIGAGLVLSLLVGFLTSSSLYVEASEATEEAEENFIAAEAARAEAVQHLADAEAASAEAQRNYEEIRRLASTFIFEVSGDIGPLEGSVQARERIVRSALQHLDRLAEEEADDPAIQVELANAYLRLGDLQGGSLNSSLGRRGEASVSYATGTAMGRALLARDEESVELRDLVARGLYRQADLDLLEGEPRRAHERLEEALSLVAVDADSSAARATRAVVLERLSQREKDEGSLDSARERLEESLELLGQIAEEHPEDARYRRDLAIANSKLAEVLGRQGRIDGAEACFLDARDLLEELIEEGTQDVGLRGVFAAVLSSLGNLYLHTGRLEDAVESLRRADEQARRLVEGDPDDVLACRNRAAGQQVLGMVFTRLDRHEEALAVLLETQDTLEELLRRDPEDRRARRDLAISLSTIAGALTQLERFDESLEYNERALAAFTALRDDDPTLAEAQRDLASCLTNFGGFHMGIGKDVHRPSAERAAHAAEAEAAFGAARAAFGALQDAGTLAPADEPYLELLEGFVDDARALGESLANE